MTYTDADLVRLYRVWSERKYAADFEDATSYNVSHFRTWLRQRETQPVRGLHDYERAMLDEYRRQERAT